MSSAQSKDLTWLITEHTPDLVLVKLYQKIERIPQDFTRLQIASARANGCAVGGYMWLYAGSNVTAAIEDVVELYREGGLVGPLFLDVETYPDDGSIPNETMIRQALAECAAHGIVGGVYTSISQWARIGNPMIECPLWTANYGAGPDLDGTPLYGAWTREMLYGHQWTSTPIDRSVFRADVLR